MNSPLVSRLGASVQVHFAHSAHEVVVVIVTVVHQEVGRLGDCLLAATANNVFGDIGSVIKLNLVTKITQL